MLESEKFKKRNGEQKQKTILKNTTKNGNKKTKKKEDYTTNNIEINENNITKKIKK